MRVLFDHQVFSWQSYGGVSRYFFEIAKGMVELGHDAIFPEDFYSENVYLRAFPGIQAKSLTSFPFKGKKWLQERLGRKASLRALRSTQPDVFHPTYFSDYFLKTVSTQKTPFVLTIHDMIHEKFGHGGKGLLSLDSNVVVNKRTLAQMASAVIVVSENTKKDVLTYIPELDPKKIHTIYHGNSMRLPEKGATRNLRLPDRYLLFVGQRNAYKNFAWMLEQLAPLIHQDSTLHLVCVGGAAFDKTEVLLMEQSGIREKVWHPIIHTDADLSELYARAQCFIFPSLYEGFGIPVIEAFSCGCPCVLNAASSLPEVGGDAALYFDTNDGAQLLNSVQTLLHDKAARDRMIAKGYARAAQFTWGRSVAAHLEVYEKISGKL